MRNKWKKVVRRGERAEENKTVSPFKSVHFPRLKAFDNSDSSFALVPRS